MPPRQPVVWDSQLRQASGSLFERLVADQENLDPPRDRDPLDARVRSVKRNLRQLLNARVGGSASAPGLGICDFNDAVTETQDMVKFIAASIRDCIENYEPRVDVVAVTHVPNPDRPLNLEFKIAADMVIDDKKQSIQIDLLMEDGKSAVVM